MEVLSVQGLCKAYPRFALRDVTFGVQPGKIVGFIGRNGAGKTTTLKAILHLLHPDSGDISYFGEPFTAENESTVKQRIGFAMGGVNYYTQKKLRVITDVTRRFYTQWDDAAYRRCLSRFALDESKTPNTLSEGMKVKYALTLALSHHAELLILDEPTSGLDPVSRGELVDIFLSLAREGVSILFSTHITGDLEACADDIVYMRSGKIVANEPLTQFTEGYRVAELTAEQAQNPPSGLIGLKPAKTGFTALVKAAQAPTDLRLQEASLTDIMVHTEYKEDGHEGFIV